MEELEKKDIRSLPLQLIITPHQSQPYIGLHNLILFILLGVKIKTLNVCQMSDNKKDLRH